MAEMLGHVYNDNGIMIRHGPSAPTLQSLAISLPELVEYVSESAPMVGSEWVHAGEGKP
jgi:hypothetical protein